MSDWKHEVSDITNSSTVNSDTGTGTDSDSDSYLDSDTLGEAFSPVHVPFTLVGVYALFETQAFTTSVAAVVGSGVLAEIVGIAFALIGLIAVGIPIAIIGGSVLGLLFGILFRDRAAALTSLVVIIPSAVVIGAGILFVPLPAAVAAFVAFDVAVYVLLIIAMFGASTFVFIQ